MATLTDSASSQSLALLLTDLESSTRLWQQYPEAMKGALERHDALLRAAVEGAKGQVVKSTGDGLFAVFASAEAGVGACLEAQQSLLAEPWQETGPLRVRMGLQVGEVQAREGDYFGPAVNRAARLMAAAHGGQVLLSAAAANLVSDRLPAAATLRDMGEHRLKDLQRPEHVFQLLHPELAADFPPIDSLSRLPNNLPVQPTALVGRQVELAEIKERLVAPEVRLLTLTGPGGTGKTSLAIEAVRLLVDSPLGRSAFANGLFFVRLAPLQSTEGLVAAVAQAINFSFYEGSDPGQQLLHYLRQKRMLLLLDNFEHLLSGQQEGPGGELFLADILQTAPQVKILVTSRARLNLQGEYLLPLAGLAVPEEIAPAQAPRPSHYGEVGAPATLPAGIEAEYSAVELFRQTARRARPAFALMGDNWPDVAAICRLVDGMPLSIVLAAAWIEVLTPAEIAARLTGEAGASFDLLASDWRDLPARQRSLRLVFEHSWQLLSPRERPLFAQMTVFRGGFSREAAQAITGASLLELKGLVNKSFLQVTPEGRYELHELLRQFGAEKLAAFAADPATRVSERAPAVRQRHSAYFCAFLQRRESELSSARQRAALLEIEADFENVRLAWRWAAGQGDVEGIEQALPGLYEFLLLRSRYREGEALLAEAAAQLAAATPSISPARLDTVRRRLSARQGAFRFYFGDLDSAESLLLATLTPETPATERAFALSILGAFAPMLGKLSLGQEYLQRSVALYRETGNLSGTANALADLALLTSGYFGDYAAAIDLADESVAIGRQLGRPDTLALALDALTVNSIFLGRYDEAEALVKERHALYQEIGGPFGDANSFADYGLLAVCRNDGPATAAIAYYGQAIAIYREIGRRLYLALNLALLAHAYYELGMFEEALAAGRESATVADEAGSFEEKALGLTWLGAAEHALGTVGSGHEHLMEALRAAHHMRHSAISTIILFNIGVALARGGDGEAAGVIARRNKARALELFVLVAGHRASWQLFKNQANSHQAKVAAQLPPTVAAAAVARGQARDLWRTVEELLEESGRVFAA